MAILSESRIESSPVHQLLVLEKVFIQSVARYGLIMPAAPAHVAKHLETVSPQLFSQIRTHVETLIETFRICAIEMVDPWNDRDFFVLSMRALKLTFPSDFLDKVSSDDVIEGYDMSRFQVFRNMRFMEKSGYSLLEILSYEWPQLFDRSTAITNKMITYCDEILWSANRTIMFDIPSHFLRELRSEDQQLFEINFRYLSPLFSGPNKPFGLVGTCSVEVLERATQNDNLAFV